MAQNPDNLSDSDETFYCPDIDKDPTESRFLDSLSENDDDFYERAYNKYCPGGLSAYHEPDSEETFFQVADKALEQDAGLLQDSEATFYSPAEHGTGAALQAPKTEDVQDEASHVVPDCLQQQDIQDMFTHDLQWTPTCSQFVKDEGLDDAAAAAAAVSPFDLYVEVPDPVTQDMRLYRVPGGQADPDTMRFFTQDLYWSQVPHAQAAAVEAVQEGVGLGQQTVPEVPDATQDLLDWTQQAGPPGGGPECSVAAASALDSSRLDTQDFAWTQPPSQGVAMDLLEVPKDEVVQTTASSGYSMDVGSAVRVVGSSGSSEGQKLPSVPSFDDDLALPCAPLWPLLPEEEFKMDEIVSSLRCMSFNLDVGPDVATDAVLGLGDGCGGPGATGSTATSSPRPSAPMPASQPRSPTFATAAARRRRRRARPRGSGLNDSKSRVVVHDQEDLGGGGGFKRKRSGVVPLSRSGSFGPTSSPRANQSGLPCSPSSPRRKARRTFGPSTSAGQGQASPRSGSAARGRLEMVAAYSRLRELRYLMQDILGSREPLPSLEEVARMQQEVLAVIVNLEEAEPRSSRRPNKATIKRQEARQVADKLLHQLRVIAECHESQGTEGVLLDGAVQRSWNNTGEVEVPLQSLSMNSNTETKLCVPKKKTLGNSETSQSIEKENIPKKLSKEKGQKSGKRKNNRKKMTQNPKQKSEESTQDNDRDAVNRVSSREIWCSCINPLKDKKTDTDRQCGTVIVNETQETNPAETVIDTYTEIPQTEIFSDAPCSNSFHAEEIKLNSGFPTETENPRDFKSSTEEAEQQKDKVDPAKDEEYQCIVELIKSKAATTLAMKTSAHKNIVQENDFFESGPVVLTGILLPKRSELEPINDFPQNFWGNPQAAIPEEWITMMEWED